MKCHLQVLVLAVLAGGGLGCQQKNKVLDAELAKFTEIKEAQARQLVSDGKLEMPPGGWKLFTAIRSDNSASAAKLFSQLDSRHSAGPNVVERAKAIVADKLGYTASLDAVDSPVWHTMLDAYWAYTLTKQWTNKFLRLAIDDIVATVPTNAILFAGSDVARFSVSAWTETQTNGRPFYVISQTQLADWNYSAYVTSTYGAKIRLPDVNAFTAVFQSEQSRSVGASSATVVKRMNSSLAQYIYVQNSANDVYLQPYWIFDWMYPHLVPEGPLLKICREPLSDLPPDSVKTNRRYWSGVCEKLIGDWITESTRPMEICDFVERVYLRATRPVLKVILIMLPTQGPKRRSLCFVSPRRTFICGGASKQARWRKNNGCRANIYWLLRNRLLSVREIPKCRTISQMSWRRSIVTMRL